MDSETENIEIRLKSFLDQLQLEQAILDRMVYKNKNQHRRCSYFQYLLKVRSDLRLLQSARLEDILTSSFLVINGKRAKQKVQLLESLKRRKCDGNYNFLERLLGAARLLSQIVEPMLKAAVEISKVLARSFFMGFSLVFMALLARLRILVQQILLDVVKVFNVASSLSRKEQSVKLNQDGVEVFRDLYPTNEQEVIFLECAWEEDKFVLAERINKPENKDQVMDVDKDLCRKNSAIQYQSIETLLGGPFSSKEDDLGFLGGLTHKTDNIKPVEDGIRTAEFLSPVDEVLDSSNGMSNPLKCERGPRNKVAFISVKKPAPSTR